MKQLKINRKKNQISIAFLVVGFFIISGCSYGIQEQSGESGTAVYSLVKDLSNNLFNTTTHSDPVLRENRVPVSDKKNTPPTADFSVIPRISLLVGMNIYFDAASSVDDDDDILAYYWDFDDGSPLFGPTPHNPVCHTFAKQGDYSVCLTVFDNAGNSGVKKMNVHISEPAL